MSPRILILVGPSGSGKSTCARYLEEHHQFLMFEASKRMTAVVPLDLPQPERLATVETFLRDHGRDYLGRRIVEDISAGDRGLIDADKRIVISGFRTYEEVSAVREAFPCTVLGIEASFELRYARLANRERSDHSGSPEHFVRLSGWEYSLGLGRLLYECDHLLINDGSLEKLFTTVATLAASSKV